MRLECAHEDISHHSKSACRCSHPHMRMDRATVDCSLPLRTLLPPAALSHGIGRPLGRPFELSQVQTSKSTKNNE